MHALRLEDDDEGAVGAKTMVATPYGDWTAPSKRKGKRRQPVALDPPYQLRNVRRSDGNQSRNGTRHPSGAVAQQQQQPRQSHKPQRKSRLKLEPMSPLPPPPANVRDGSEKEASEASSKLQSEIQWIHRHLPVLKLATTKNSRSLRQQLFVSAIAHAATNLALRRCWRRWTNCVIQFRRDELRRLRASRTVMVKLITASMSSLAHAFQHWYEDMVECREQEALASAVAIQRWTRSLAREKQRQTEARSLAETLRLMDAHASAIQRGYRRYRRILRLRECQRAATRMQHVLRERLRHRRRASEEAAALTIQHAYRRHRKRRQHKREAVARLAFELGRAYQARRIQRCWRCYASWKCNELPASCVEFFVGQVEFLFAVQSIQRNIRRYQWRIRIEKRRQAGACCIQRNWRSSTRRERAREERKAVRLEREMGVRCLQRTYRRSREQRKYREVMKSSTRPLYLRMLEVDDPAVRVRLHVEIARSAVLVIQTVWRKHRAYVILVKQRRLDAAAAAITCFMRRARRRCVWLRLVSHTLNASRRAKAPPRATRTIQRWLRRVHGKEDSRRQQQQLQSAIQQLAALMSAAIAVQRYHRRRKDPWRRVLLRVFHHERPRQVDAVVRIQTWWRREQYRKRAAIERKRSLLDIIEQRQQVQRRDTAARRIQRAYRRFLDRRNGRLLLKRYQILMRQELKKRQQRAVIHSFLQEEGHRRDQRQRKKNGGGGGLRTASPIFGAKPLNAAANTATASDTNAGTTAATPASADPSPEYPVQEADGRIRYWSEEYQRAYLFDPSTGDSTWL